MSAGADWSRTCEGCAHIVNEPGPKDIYTLRDMGFDPYVMIYDKPNAPREIRLLQRWCNNRLVFRAEPDFYKFDPKRG